MPTAGQLMAPSPNIPQEIGIYALYPSYSNSETCLADFSLFGGAESLPDAKQPAPWLPRRTEIPRPENAQDVYDSTPQDPSDFLWLMTEEPHRSRRRAIMQAHPKVSFESPYLCFLLFSQLYPALARLPGRARQCIA